MLVSDIIVRDVVKVKESERIRDVLERFLLYQNRRASGRERPQ